MVIWCDLLGDIQSWSDAIPCSGSLLPRQVPGSRAAAWETRQCSMHRWDVSQLIATPGIREWENTPLLTPSRYSIMLRCWCENAGKRPPFSKLVVDITTSLNDIAGYVDFSCLSVVDKEGEEGHLYNRLAEQDQDAWEVWYSLIIIHWEYFSVTLLDISKPEVTKIVGGCRDIYFCVLCCNFSITHFQLTMYNTVFT